MYLVNPSLPTFISTVVTDRLKLRRATPTYSKTEPRVNTFARNLAIHMVGTLRARVRIRVSLHTFVTRMTPPYSSLTRTYSESCERLKIGGFATTRLLRS